MMLDGATGSFASQRQHPKTAVFIDLPPAVLFSKLKLIFPGRTRLGVLRGPTETDCSMAALREAARQAGFTVEILDCREPRDLVRVFLRFKSRVDFNGARRARNSIPLRRHGRF